MQAFKENPELLAERIADMSVKEKEYSTQSYERS
jgi:hypothetical protein